MPVLSTICRSFWRTYIRNSSGIPMQPHCGCFTSQLVVTQTWTQRNSEPNGPGGIVVHVRQLHLRPVILCRRVIEGELDELTNMTDGNLPNSDMQQWFGDVLCLAAQCLQKVVVIRPVIRNNSSPKAAGHSSAATSRQHSPPKKRIPASSIQNAGENFTLLRYTCWRDPCSHPGAPSGRERFLVKQSLPTSPVAASTELSESFDPKTSCKKSFVGID